MRARRMALPNRVDMVLEKSSLGISGAEIMSSWEGMGRAALVASMPISTIKAQSCRALRFSL